MEQNSNHWLAPASHMGTQSTVKLGHSSYILMRYRVLKLMRTRVELK